MPPNQQVTPPTPTSSNPNTPFEPAPFTPPLGSSPAPKKSRKRFIIGGVVAAFLVLVGAGSALAYTIYQSPDKLVADALSGAIAAKSFTVNGDFKATEKAITSGDEKEVIAQYSVASEGVKASGDLDVTIDGVQYGGSFMSAGDKGVYAKVKNVKQIVASIFGEEAAAGPMKSFITTVDEKWIRFDNNDNDAATQKYSDQQKCYKTVADTYYKNKLQREQIINAYGNNPIFVAKANGEQTIGGVESLRVILMPDYTKYAGFVAALKKTEVVKALDKCSEGDLTKSLDEGVKNIDTTKETTAKIELGVSKWDHTLTQAKLSTTEKDGSTVASSARPLFNKPVTVQAPTESLSLKQVYEAFIKAVLGGARSGGATPSTQLN